MKAPNTRDSLSATIGALIGALLFAAAAAYLPADISEATRAEICREVEP